MFSVIGFVNVILLFPIYLFSYVKATLIRTVLSFAWGTDLRNSIDGGFQFS